MVSSSIGVELGWKWVNKNFFILSIKKKVRDRPCTTLLVTSHIHEKYQKLESL